MKKMKKLFPALCLLLVSATLLGTSTYAWFSMNSTVTATGMEIKAKTSKNLLISKESNANFGLSVDLQNSTTTMQPATSSNGKNFYKTTKNADSYSNYEITGLVNADLSAATSDTHYQKNTVYLKSESETESFSKFYVSGITSEGFTALGDLAKSLRVSVVYEDTAKIYAPVEGNTATYKAGDTLIDTTPIAREYNDANAISATINNTGIKVDIYVWFEGQDENCTSAKAALQTAAASLTLTFYAE